MTNGRIVELRDPDGQYATVRIIEEALGRVVSANGGTIKAGDLLLLPEGETWDSASEELGSYTRLGPDDLIHQPFLEEAEDPLIVSIEEELDQDDEVVRETHARAERRPPLESILPPWFSIVEEEEEEEEEVQERVQEEPYPGEEVDRFPKRFRFPEEDVA